MRVLSNIAEKAIALVDHAAGTWLSRMEEDASERDATVAVLRRLVVYGVTSLVVFPAAFSLVISPSIALPIGAALVVATFLAMAAFLIAFRRPTASAAQSEKKTADDGLLAA